MACLECQCLARSLLYNSGENALHLELQRIISGNKRQPNTCKHKTLPQLGSELPRSISTPKIARVGFEIAMTVRSCGCGCHADHNLDEGAKSKRVRYSGRTTALVACSKPYAS